jgi:hypothetical protein
MRLILTAVVSAVMLTGGCSDHALAPDEHNHAHNESVAADEQLGPVSFPTSCAAKSQALMQRGVALLHSFGYAQAQLQFEALARADPTCAMAHWGIAMTQFRELWEYPDKAALKRGATEMATARALASASAHRTPLESAYIEALGAYFNPPKASLQERADAYAAAMNALHSQFPDSVEGAAFDALAILAAHPSDDTSLEHERKALAILLPAFEAHPTHPGLAHYIIHACDTPALAPEGLPAAKVYARLAPSSAHALHMPSHIFARLGMWQEDIASNLASVEASQKAEESGQPGSAHQMHADEFLIYAYLQVGQDEKAWVLTDSMHGLADRMRSMSGMDDMKDSGRYFDNEVRVIRAMEMHDWKTLSTLQPARGSDGSESLPIYWGRGVAAGHLRDAKLAAAALASFDREMAKITKDSASGAHPGLEIRRQEIQAWKNLTDGFPNDAVAALRWAANEQDKRGQGEVDIPAREMLADLLLLEHQPADALNEYRAALTRSPARLNGLLSAGAAAEQVGQPEQASAFYQAAAQQADLGAHSRRPELLHAVQVASQPATGSRPSRASSR